MPLPNLPMLTPHPLLPLLERQARAFGGQLPGAIEGEVEPVHQCRVATRRLRELLPLCERELSAGIAGRARRRLRRVGRAMGPVREVDVALELADELARQQVVRDEAAERLRQHLRDEREERREQMLDRLRAINTLKLERDLADVARLLGMRQQTDAWALGLASRMEGRAQTLLETVEAAGPLYIADRVHAVRIATKRLRYVLELAGDTGEARTKRAVRDARGVQETLGRLHDLDVLADLMQELIAAAAGQPWREPLKAARLHLERECRSLHGQYVARQEAVRGLGRGAEEAGREIWIERGGDDVPAAPPKRVGRVLKMTLWDPRPGLRPAAEEPARYGAAQDQPGGVGAPREQDGRTGRRQG